MSKIGAIVLVSSLGFALPSPASANTLIDQSLAGGTSTSQTSVSPECVAQVTALYNAGKIPDKDTSHCSATTTTWTSASTVPDEHVVINSMEGMSLAEQSGINASLNAGTIRSKSWKQTMNGATYSQSHSGVFFYDGARAWSTSAYRNRQGSHQCYTNWAVAVGITDQYCGNSWNGTYLTEGHRFYISYVWKGSPIGYSRSIFADHAKSGRSYYRY